MEKAFYYSMNFIFILSYYSQRYVMISTSVFMIILSIIINTSLLIHHFRAKKYDNC